MKVYHKPSCITCKRALSELERMKIDFETRDIFKDPLSEDEIKQILHLSKMTPREIKYMAEHPGLIKRPIIFTKGGVRIGKIDNTPFDW
jgi:arsenate reductase (glutaredoxin)